MKKIILYFAAAVISLTASAQSTRVIKGAVIDKNGNPLPGATVEATGGSEVATVDADGTFSLEVPIWLKSATARYAGMKKNTMKVKGYDMIFRMSSGRKTQWYLMANYSHIFGGDYYDYDKYENTHGNMIGLMTGCLGKWGWYTKFNFGKCVSDHIHHDYWWTSSGYKYYNWENETETFACNLTMGMSKRIVDPLHAYVGFGFAKEPVRSGVCPVVDFGLIGKVKKHFLIHAGYQLQILETTSHVINAGVGYAF